MTTPTHTPAHPGTIHQRVHKVADALTSSLRGVLGSHHATGLALEERYGLNRVLCHRLSSALRRADPIAALYQLPGPEPLRRFLDAARTIDANDNPIRHAAAAIDDFEELIRTVGGDRSGLDAIVSNWMPETRTRFESEAKQLVYRGMRQLKGVASDTMLNAAILHPGADPNRLDMTVVQGHYALRCVRPDTRLRLSVKSMTANAPGAEVRTIDGKALKDNPHAAVLTQFGRGAAFNIEVHAQNDTANYMLDWGDAVGLESSCDIVLADVHTNGPRRLRTADDPRPRTGIVNTIDIPTRLFVCDLLLHQDAYPDWTPNVRVLETGAAGIAFANDPTRDLDVLPIQESIEHLGTGVNRCRIESIPNYIELLEHAFASTGQNPSAFRAYRTRIEYPVFGTQIQHLFEVPIAR